MTDSLETSFSGPTGTRWGWLAGLYEGEGSLSPHASDTGWTLAIHMTDEDVIRRACEVAGLGNVRGPYDMGPGRKPSWTWAVCRSEDIVVVVTGMLPWLCQRRTEKIQLFLASRDANVRRRVMREDDRRRIVEDALMSGDPHGVVAKRHGCSRSQVQTLVARGGTR